MRARAISGQFQLPPPDERNVSVEESGSYSRRRFQSSNIIRASQWVSVVRCIVFLAPLHNPVKVSTSVPGVKIWPGSVTPSDPVGSNHSHVSVTRKLLAKNLETMVCDDIMRVSLSKEALLSKDKAMTDQRVCGPSRVHQ